jgi:hypothetical protein
MLAMARLSQGSEAPFAKKRLTMKPVMPLFWTATATALILLLTTSVWASGWNQLTYFTFSAPVALPGVALPPGTYIFKRPDSVSYPHVVRVLSEDRQIVYGTFMTMPEVRGVVTDEPAVTFEERPAGEPEAIKAWFYPGRSIGYEFIYPEEEQMIEIDPAVG